MRNVKHKTRRGTVLLLIVGLLAMLFIVVSAYIMLARFERQTLIMVRQGQRIEDIVSAAQDMLMWQLAPTRTSGSVTTTGGPTIPGYGDTGSRWLSAGPIRDASNSGTGIRDYVVVPTNLEATDAGAVPMDQTMADGDGSGAVGLGPAPTGIDPQDLQANAREPVTDANGSGVLIEFFADPRDPKKTVGTRGLTEMANAIANVAVSTHLVTLWNWKNDPSVAHFRQLARYIPVVRVISHGGMVSIGLPPNAGWAQQFAQHMFNYVRHPSDGDALDPTQVNDVRLLNAVWDQSASVEPMLRRRVLLPGPEDSPDSADWPELSLLLRSPQHPLGFEATLSPFGYFNNVRLPRPWERFNLASPPSPGFGKMNDWTVWRQAMYLDPQELNRFWYAGATGTGGDPRSAWVSRSGVTSHKLSDEMAWVSKNPAAVLAPGALPGLTPGQLKFALAKITDQYTPPNSSVPVGAFRKDGTFNSTDPLPGKTTAQGRVVINELANYFYEMLSQYEDWTIPAASTLNQTDMRRRQAFMLAVNLAAFAAPRSPERSSTPGAIDAPWYLDSYLDAQGAQHTAYYWGYTPQPFITQVMAHNSQDQPGAATAKIAIAIELCNPNDGWPGANDQQALYLPQFAISINDGYVPVRGQPTIAVNLRPLDPGNANMSGMTETRLDGRTYKFFSVHAAGGNPSFDTLPGVAGKINLSVPLSDPIKVKLWQTGIADLAEPIGKRMYHLVDEMEIKTDNQPQDVPWHVNVHRDTSFDPYIGPDAKGHLASWRIVMAAPSDDPLCKTEGPSSGAPPVLPPGQEQLGTALPMPTTGFYGPSTPLYTMNADVRAANGRPVTVAVHGAQRPASFPTVGFMLFVPRFAHFEGSAGAVSERHPAGRMMYLELKGNKPAASLADARADFGHMPIFDNRQDVSTNSDFKKTGRIPWGLLVWNYFTTLNPAGDDGLPNTTDDIDLYRVPGRIDINTASWNVLSGLPVIGPERNGNLPIHLAAGSSAGVGSNQETNASAAFWSVDSNVLVGQDSTADHRPRFNEVLDTPAKLASPQIRDPSGWYRLGPYLAEAAAEYRDRVKYTVAGNLNQGATIFPEAFERNRVNPYRAQEIRGQDNMARRGFLSVGELANVMGFDSSNADDIKGGPQNTVLGGYGTVNGGDFMKAVSLMALLDTHFLTTSSNTFTIYVTVNDLENPQASVRSQLTVDRSNLLPRVIWVDSNNDGIRDAPPVDHYDVLANDGQPEIIAQREIAYFNTRYDN